MDQDRFATCFKTIEKGPLVYEIFMVAVFRKKTDRVRALLMHSEGGVLGAKAAKKNRLTDTEI